MTGTTTTVAAAGSLSTTCRLAATGRDRKPERLDARAVSDALRRMPGAIVRLTSRRRRRSRVSVI